VACVLGQNRAQVLLASDDHPVGALSPYRAHEALGIGIHPGRLGRDWQCFDSIEANAAVNLVSRLTSSSGTGGRPGGLGWRHFAAARRRCQRSSVPGVTIRQALSVFGMILVSAAR
jgi:hypothetical protein